MYHLGFVMLVIICITLAFLAAMSTGGNNKLFYILTVSAIATVLSAIFIVLGTERIIINKYAAEVPTTIAEREDAKFYEFRGRVEVTKGHKIKIPVLIPGTTVEIGGKTSEKK